MGVKIYRAIISGMKRIVERVGEWSHTWGQGGARICKGMVTYVGAGGARICRGMVTYVGAGGACICKAYRCCGACTG